MVQEIPRGAKRRAGTLPQSSNLQKSRWFRAIGGTVEEAIVEDWPARENNRRYGEGSGKRDKRTHPLRKLVSFEKGRVLP